MKIPSINSSQNVAKGSSIQKDVVSELSQVSSELAELNQYNRDKRRAQTAENNSPYPTDRPSHNPTQIFGTEREKEWKKVSISREADLKKVDTETAAQKEEYIQDLKNKLNII
ncbi:hypothetical protein [Halobacteriovorax sp. HLS]|uniref:hypothetical protein n=1 Tax=Halobacteriovorax sp. HLS TaxID=2234000 RepID=UPI000FD76B9F|nr:hypothetical protein [Halobacteriovorax sp. HLS]